jgi:hypothetical protein
MEPHMPQTRTRTLPAAGLAALVVALAAFWWLNRSTNVTGEIRDDAIVLSAAAAGNVVNFELRNAGSQPCQLIVVLTPLAIDALPSQDARVVTYDGTAVQMGPDGQPPAGVPVVGFPTQINGATASFGQSVQSGEIARFQLAFDRTPRTDERVVLCNGTGQYANGRRASLRFER